MSLGACLGQDRQDVQARRESSGGAAIGLETASKSLQRKLWRAS